MPSTFTLVDHALALVADLLELAARRVWGGAGAEVPAHTQTVGLGLYLAHSRFHARLDEEFERVGIDPAADPRSSDELLGAAAQVWRDLPRSARPTEWAALLEELRARHREVRALEH